MASDAFVSLVRGVLCSAGTTLLGLILLIAADSSLNSESAEEALVSFGFFLVITFSGLAILSLLIATAAFVPGSWLLARQQRTGLSAFMAYGAAAFASGGLALGVYLLPALLLALTLLGAAAGASFWWGGVRLRATGPERDSAGAPSPPE